MAYWKGIETLAPLEREAIIKQLAKGSVGGAALLYGYFDSERVDKFFKSMPRWFGHVPIAMAIREGGYLKRMGSPNEDIQKQGTKDFKFFAKESIPFMYSLTDITDALDTHDSGALLKWIHNMTTSTVDPQLLQQIAKAKDKPGSFPSNYTERPTYRKPESMLDAIKVGIPGLREQVNAPIPQRVADMTPEQKVMHRQQVRIASQKKREREHERKFGY
jgi:hypothetical protein